jgi:hypothetical protein
MGYLSQLDKGEMTGDGCFCRHNCVRLHDQSLLMAQRVLGASEVLCVNLHDHLEVGDPDAINEVASWLFQGAHCV